MSGDLSLPMRWCQNAWKEKKLTSGCCSRLRTSVLKLPIIADITSGEGNDMYLCIWFRIGVFFGENGYKMGGAGEMRLQEMDRNDGVMGCNAYFL